MCARSSALRDQGVSAVEASRRVLAAERAGTSPLEGESADEADPRPCDAGRASPAPTAAIRHPLATGRAPAALRTDPQMLVAQLLDAVTALDEDRAHAVLDTAFLERSVESAIVDVLLPLFVRVGEMWELGRIGIAQEHFASSLVRRRLGALSLTWGVGVRPGGRARLPSRRVPRHRPAELRRAPRPRRLARPLPRAPTPPSTRWRRRPG